MRTIDKFLKNFKECFGNLSEACEKTGLRRHQVIKHSQENEAFALRLWEICEGFIDQIETTNYKAALLGDKDAIKLFLNAKAKSRGYGKIETVTVNDFIPGITKPTEQDPSEQYTKQIVLMDTADIEASLKKVRDDNDVTT